MLASDWFNGEEMGYTVFSSVLDVNCRMYVMNKSLCYVKMLGIYVEVFMLTPFTVLC